MTPPTIGRADGQGKPRWQRQQRKGWQARQPRAIKPGRLMWY